MYVCGAKLGLNKSEIRSVVALYILYKAHYLVHKAIEWLLRWGWHSIGGVVVGKVLRLACVRK